MKMRNDCEIFLNFCQVIQFKTQDKLDVFVLFSGVEIKN